MSAMNRRKLFGIGLAASLGTGASFKATDDLHQQILDLSAKFEAQRRARFAAVKTQAELNLLQTGLRQTFLNLLRGLPSIHDKPAVTQTGEIEADGYTIRKIAFESLPGYHVTALLYVPHGLKGRAPGVISPSGHTHIGKAYPEHQILHANLAKRGFVVLAHDPVGQAERSQFWNPATRRTRYNLGCGEHAVLGNALELLGTNLARYRIWDGIRGLDLLGSLPEVDSQRIGCVGHSGGGTLTAYLTALDQRIRASAICCYVTTLPLRMGNRIQDDPSSDPEQDIFGFVKAGIDHSGLLAMCAPRPTLIAAATKDFFPIEGTRKSFAEAQHLYQVADAGDCISMVEAPFRHGLALPLRQAVYGWFSRWLAGDAGRSSEEIAVKEVPADQLMVCQEGQVRVSFQSRSLFDVALEEFKKTPKTARKTLADAIHLNMDKADPRMPDVSPAIPQPKSWVVCINGNESADWREAKDFISILGSKGHGLIVLDPRGVGPRRVKLSVKGHDYADPISSVEANLAYNAFLVGETLVGMRTADTISAVRNLINKNPGMHVTLVGRKDAGIIALMAASIEPRISAVAVEEIPESFMGQLSETAAPLNAASTVPGLLADFGDIPEILETISPRRMLLARSSIKPDPKLARFVTISEERFSDVPKRLADWLA